MNSDLCAGTGVGTPSVTYVYNDAGLITNTTQTSIGGPSVTLTYQCDDSGRRTQMAAWIDGTADFNIHAWTYGGEGAGFSRQGPRSLTPLPSPPFLVARSSLLLPLTASVRLDGLGSLCSSCLGNCG
jgi:hypothetical protein